MELVAWIIVIGFVLIGFLAVVDSAGGPGGCLVIGLIVLVPISLMAWACSTILDASSCDGYYAENGEPCD